MGTTLGSEDYDGILDLADTLPLMYEEEEDDTVSSMFHLQYNTR